MNEPRLIALVGAPHPQARIDSVDLVCGIVVFTFIRADAAPADSGGSIAHFTPSIVTPATDSEPAVYAEPDEATLEAAIMEALAAQPTTPAAEQPSIGSRMALAGSFSHEEIATSSGGTLLGIIPAGWAMVDFQARVDTAFDTGRTISVGTAASPTRWVSALAVSTVGLKQATPLQLYPQSVANATSVYLKKSAATTVGDIINVTALIERKY